MSKPLIPGRYYHIYNRGNNGENIFREERNYRYFLQLYAQYIHLIAETYAYCLMVNHFHLLLRIREAQDCQSSEDWQSYVSLQFRNFFSTYTKAMNKAYKRTGSLFEKPFKRKLVDNESYFISLIAYIHRNPQTHGFIDDFRQWPWSSYGVVLSQKPTKVQRDDVLGWFGGRSAFEDGHILEIDEKLIEPLILDDFV